MHLEGRLTERCRHTIVSTNVALNVSNKLCCMPLRASHLVSSELNLRLVHIPLNQIYSYAGKKEKLHNYFIMLCTIIFPFKSISKSLR